MAVRVEIEICTIEGQHEHFLAGSLGELSLVAVGSHDCGGWRYREVVAVMGWSGRE
jgi:hypothetical protein